MTSEPSGGYYARRVGEIQRDIQSIRRELRALVGRRDHGYVKLGLREHGLEEEELLRRGEEIAQAAERNREQVFQLAVDLQTLEDLLEYYRQQELAYADGTVADDR